MRLGVWRSLVARSVRVGEVPSSNLGTPIQRGATGSPLAVLGLSCRRVWVVNSFCIAGLVLSPWYELAGVLAVVRGACVGFSIAVWETMMMELVPENMLSRVVSLDFFGSFGLMPVGLAFSAAIAGMASPGTIIAAGAGFSAVLIAAVLTRPWLRAVD